MGKNNLLCGIELERIYQVARILEKPLILTAKQNHIPVYEYRTERDFYKVKYLKKGDEIIVEKEWYHPLNAIRLGILEDARFVVLIEEWFDGWNI